MPMPLKPALPHGHRARGGLVALALCLGASTGAWAREAPPAPAKGTPPAAAALYAQAMATLKGCQMGEHERKDCAEPAYAQLAQAAQAGHVEAQFAFGSRQFSHRFQQAAPDPKSAADRAAYVTALTWLASAAHAGHARAKTYLPPDVMQVLLTGKAAHLLSGKAADLEPPFGDLPVLWLLEAAKAAKAAKGAQPATAQPVPAQPTPAQPEAGR